MRKKTQLIITLITAVFIALGIFSVYRRIGRENIPGAGTSLHSGEARLSRGDETKLLRNHLRTLLIIGTDDYSYHKLDEDIFYNNRQADFIAVLVFDNANKTVQPIQINRDTMCDVPWLTLNGFVGGTVFEQITLAFNSGSGREDSCRNTENAVSNLLFGLPFDYYMAFTMDAVPALTDLVGGVYVTLEDDLSYIDPSFTKGNTVLLTGRNSLFFVRTRDQILTDANAVRMGRHRQFLYGFAEAAKMAKVSDDDISVEAYSSLSEYIVTNLTFNSYADVVNWLSDYELLPIISPDGTYLLGEMYAEFYVDESSLWDILLKSVC